MTDTTGEVSQGDTSGQTHEEFVEIEKADDADIDQFLDRYKAGEFDETDSNEPQPNEAPQEEKIEDKPQPQEEAEENITLSRRELLELQEKIRKGEEARQQQEKFIQRRNTELGEARKELKQVKAALEAKLEDKFQESPVEAMKDVQKIRDIDSEIENIDAQEKSLQQATQTHALVSKYVKLDEVPVNHVVQVLKEDGMSEDGIKQFLSDPYNGYDAGFLIQLYKRSQDLGKMFKLATYTRNILTENENLRKENESLKSKPNRLLQNVEKELSKGPNITSANGNAGAKRSIVDADVTKLSDKDLDELLKQANKAN